MLWHDQWGEPFATITVETDEDSLHREHRRIESDGFKLWVQREFWRAKGAPPTKESLNEAIGLAKARALFDGPMHRTWIRVARHKGRLYLDLTDDAWRVVEIDSEGWRLCDDPPVRFRRTGGEALLPLPVDPDDPLALGAEGAIAALRQLVRPRNPEHMKLIIGWLVACLCPDYPIAALILACEYGSAKTSALRAIRSHVDPRVLMTAGLPSKEDDIVVAAYAQWVLSADNISTIPPDLSDVLCRVVTGGGMFKRKLYSDADVHAIDVQRPIIMTALGMPTVKPDFVDRSIALELKIIEREERLTEAEVKAKLEALRPELLSVLLTGASFALRREAEVREALRGQLERLADFCVWVEAAAPAFGWADGEFLDVHSRMLNDRKAETAEDDQLCDLIRDWMTSPSALAPEDGVYEETAGELRKRLAAVANRDVPIDSRGRRPSEAEWFPRTPRALSNRLSERRRLLEAIGIRYTDRQHPHSSTRGKLHKLELLSEGAAMADARRRQWRAEIARVEEEMSTEGD